MLVNLPVCKMQEDIIDNTEDKKHKSIFKTLLRICGRKTKEETRTILHRSFQKLLSGESRGSFSSPKFPAAALVVLDGVSFWSVCADVAPHMCGSCTL